MQFCNCCASLFTSPLYDNTDTSFAQRQIGLHYMGLIVQICDFCYPVSNSILVIDTFPIYMLCQKDSGEIMACH
jgi:hypothetical protein